MTSFGKRSAVSLRLVIFAPTTSCRWNATRPSGQQGPRLRLADVVQQRGQPDDQVALEPVLRLELDGLPQYGEAVLVDVLVPVVLVGLHPEPGHLGQHLLGDSVWTSRSMPSAGSGVSISLVSSP